jgi:hypothetical protein
MAQKKEKEKNKESFEKKANSSCIQSIESIHRIN